MSSFSKRVTVGHDHQIRIELDVPVDFPVGEAEMTVELKPIADTESMNRSREIHGMGKNKSWMSEDFDSPLDDFAEYMKEGVTLCL